MPRDKLSNDSMAEASRDRSKLSGHGNAKGAAGYRPEEDEHEEQRLSGFGETVTIDHGDKGFDNILIGASWDNIQTKKKDGKQSLLKKVVKKVARQGVDVDLGCLYELQNGERGAIQAFGDMYGDLTNAPFVSLSGDERTGDKKGEDEIMTINGRKWPEIKRLLVYVYIYTGAPDWATLRPRINIRIPGEGPLTITPGVKKNELAVCAIAGIENVRNALQFTNYGEYFLGHAEMDRAYGFGLDWDDGKK